MDDINNTLSSLGLSSANLSSLLALAADVTDMEPTHRGIVLGVQTRVGLHDTLSKIMVLIASSVSMA